MKCELWVRNILRLCERMVLLRGGFVVKGLGSFVCWAVGLRRLKVKWKSNKQFTANELWRDFFMYYAFEKRELVILCSAH
jgi:hypothetical protein